MGEWCNGLLVAFVWYNGRNKGVQGKAPVYTFIIAITKIIEIKFILLQHTLFHRFSPLKFSICSKHRKVALWKKKGKRFLLKIDGKVCRARRKLFGELHKQRSIIYCIFFVR